jgi:hypothetical protein
MILLSKYLQTSNLFKKTSIRRCQFRLGTKMLKHGSYKNFETRFLQKCMVTLYIIFSFLSLVLFCFPYFAFFVLCFTHFRFLPPPPFNLLFSSFLIPIPPLLVSVPATPCWSGLSSQNGYHTLVLARLLRRDRQSLFDRKRSPFL